MKIVLSIICVALALSPKLCFASQEWNGFTKLSEDGLPDKWMWSDFDGWIKDTLATFNEDRRDPSHSWHIKFELDKKSFKDFYKQEFTHEKLRDRVDSTPQSICSNLMNYFRTDAYGGRFSQQCKNDDSCAKAIGRSVKKIECAIKQGANASAVAKVTFVNGVLRGESSRRPDGDLLHPSNEAIEKSLRSAIPDFDKFCRARD